jgi:hypothetical protein
MEMHDATNYPSYALYISSEAAYYLFNTNVKSEKNIENEPFHSVKKMFNIHHIRQVLLNNRLFLALMEPAGFVAGYLRDHSNQAVQALKTYETLDGGWMATASQSLMNRLASLMNRLDLCDHFVSIFCNTGSRPVSPAWNQEPN